MTAPILKWYDGATLIEAPEDLTAATPGTPSTLSNFDLWNDKDGAGADTAYNKVIEITCRTPLSAAEIVAGTPPRPFVSAGNEVTDGYWFEARINAGLGDLTLATGPWTPLGTGRWLKLPPIASESGVSIDVRLNTPGGPQNRSIEWALSVNEYGSRPLPIGLHESIGYGVALGIGDDTYTDLLYISGPVVENPGGADEFVELPDISVVCAGIPHNLITQLLEITDEDSAAATLIAGERYQALIYIDADGAIAQAKSVKTSGTADTPALPAGGVPIAYVIREFDGLVNDADITQAWTVGAAHFSSTNLTGSIGPYRIVNDNRLCETQTSTTVTLTAASTNRVWHHPDGSLSVTTTAAKPEERAMLLWEAVTDGSAVTSSTDRRLFYGLGYRIQRLDVTFEGAPLAAADVRHAAYQGNRTAYIIPIGGVGLFVDGSGTVADDTIFDIEMRAPGGAFTTIFTSQGSEDRRPTITVAGSTLQSTNAFPEVLAVPAYSVFRWVADQVPDTTTPDVALGTILLAVP